MDQRRAAELFDELDEQCHGAPWFAGSEAEGIMAQRGHEKLPFTGIYDDFMGFIEP